MNKSFIVYVLINYSKHSPPLLKIQQASLSQLHPYANDPSNKFSPYDIRKTQTSVMYVAGVWYTQEKKRKIIPNQSQNAFKRLYTNFAANINGMPKVVLKI